MATRKKILLLTEIFRHEVKRGIDKRLLCLLETLLKEFDITWLSIVPFETKGIPPHYCSGNVHLQILTATYPERTFIQRIKNKLGNLYFNYLGEFSYSHYMGVSILVDALQKTIDLNEYDYVLLQYLAHAPMLEYLQSKKQKCKIVIDTTDVQSERVRKVIALESRIQLFLKSVFLYRMKKSEDAALLLADIVIALSKEDQKYFEERLHCKDVWYCPSGLSLDTSVPTETEKHNWIIFYGAMNSLTNYQAANYFKQTIYPRIIERVPDAKYFIVGSNPRPEVLAMQDETTTVTGYVEDISVYFSKAKCFVCPLQVSYGERVRMYEVMAQRTPCVVSSLAVKGMNLEGIEGVEIEDDPDNYADSVIRILTDQDLRNRMGKSVRTWVEKNGSIEATYGKLVAYLQSHN